MSINIKKIILHKQKGNSTSLVSGILILMLVIIIIMYTFRVNLLSEVIYNMDDITTVSSLAALTPNENAYKIDGLYKGQLILQSEDVFGVSLVGYDSSELNTLASELDETLITRGVYDANAILDPGRVHSAYSGTGFSSYKKVGASSDYGSESYVKSKIVDRTITYNDYYMLETLGRMVSVPVSNITHGSVVSDKPTELFDSATKAVTDSIKKSTVISKSTLDKSFIGGYVPSDMYITRAEIYNVYRYTLAKRHVYASPYLMYKVNGVEGYTWDGYNIDGSKITGLPGITVVTPDEHGVLKSETTTEVSKLVNKTIPENAVSPTTSEKCNGIDIEIQKWNGPTTTSSFRSFLHALYPALIVRGHEPEEALANGEISESDYKLADALEAMWDRDYKAYNDRDSKPLIFWEDTGITYNSKWYSTKNPYRFEYAYLWDNNNKNSIKIEESTLLTDSNGDKILPIEGYSSYIYIKDNADILTQYNNFSMSNGVLNDYSLAPIKLGDYNKNYSTLDNLGSDTHYNSNEGTDDTAVNAEFLNRKTNADIYYTTVYVEYIFDVNTFPNNPDDNLLHIGAYSTKTLRMSKIVSAKQAD